MYHARCRLCSLYMLCMAISHYRIDSSLSLSMAIPIHSILCQPSVLYSLLTYSLLLKHSVHSGYRSYHSMDDHMTGIHSFL